MEREGEEDLDKDGWTHSWGTRAEPPSATRRYARDRAGCRQESDATRRHKVTR